MAKDYCVVTLNCITITLVYSEDVTGLGPDYIIPGPRPELTLLALRFRQVPFLSLM